MDITNCPYCGHKNQMVVNDWERPRCYHCEGVFYVEVVRNLSVRGFEENGKDVDATIDGDSC